MIYKQYTNVDGKIEPSDACSEPSLRPWETGAVGLWRVSGGDARDIFVADSGSGNKMISSFSLNGSFNFQDNFWSWTPERNQVIGSNDRIGGYHERVADVYSGCKGGAAESQSETMPPLSPLNVRVKVI